MRHEPKISLSQKLLHGVVFAVGVALLSKPSWNPWPDLGKAVGEAFLIALLVIYLVEVSSHQRLENTAEEIIRKIGKNIIPLIYGHELPQALVEALEANTLLQPVYRDRMALQIELTKTSLPRALPLPPLSEQVDTSNAADVVTPSPRPEDGAVVQPLTPLAPGAGAKPPEPTGPDECDDGHIRLCKLACTYSYSLINCSDEAVKMPLKVSLERDKWLAEIVADGQSEPELQYVKVGNKLFVEEENRAEVLSRLGLPAETEVHSLNNKAGPRHSGNDLVFEIEDFAVPAKGSVAIMFHGTLHKRISDNEVWSTSFPTLQVDLSIASVDFEVEARFPDSGTMLDANLGNIANTWSYKAPLLTGQTVLFWWRPKA